MDKITELLKEGIENGVFPNNVYKFRDFSDFTDKIILNSEFYFASPKRFNDPFDCNLSYRQDYTEEEILKKYEYLASKLSFSKEQFIEKYGSSLNDFLNKYPKLNGKTFSIIINAPNNSFSLLSLKNPYLQTFFPKLI